MATPSTRREVEQRPLSPVDRDPAVRFEPAVTRDVSRGSYASFSSEAEELELVTSRRRFVILETLGRSATRTISKAYDSTLRREVVLEVLPPQTADDHRHARLMGEAQAMAALSHPNIVAVYGVTTDGPNAVLVLESVPGQTLPEWLAARPRLWRDVLDVFLQAGAGLSAAHRLSLVHRAFWPGCILISNERRAVVGNFGLAELERDDSNGAGEGRRYWAPEQLAGEPPDTRSDQYAFCLAFWEALCGAYPFPTASVDELARSKREGPPPWPKHVRVPRRIVAALERGLASQPELRWPTMQALLQSIQPATSRKLWHVGVSALSLTAVAASWLFVWQSEREQRCSGARAQLVGIWDSTSRGAVERALLTTGISYAPATWTRVEAGLERYAEEWIAQYGSACRATAVEGTQSEAALNLRMGCLHRRKVELASVVDVLAQADAQVLEKAVQTVSRLPSLSRCADLEALQAEVPPPESPQDASKVERARTIFAQAIAQEAAGQYVTALATIEAAEAELAHVDYAPLRAELMLRKGLAFEQQGQYAEAATTFERAVALALVAGTLEAGPAMANLALVLGQYQGRLAEALWLSEIAIELARAHDHDGKEASARNNRALLLWQQGRFVEAEAEHRHAIPLFERIHGVDHPEVADVRNNLATGLAQQGRLAEAEAEYRAAVALREKVVGGEHPRVAEIRNNLAAALHGLGRHEEAEVESRHAIATFEHGLGEDHPKVAFARATLGIILHSQARYEGAEAEFRRALSLFEKTLGAKHPNVAFVSHKLGDVLVRLGRDDDARRELERAWSIRSNAPVPPAMRAETAFALAQLVWNSGEDSARAVRLAEAAVKDYGAAGGATNELRRRAELWLAERIVRSE